VINNLKPKASSGHDKISPKIVKTNNTLIAGPLAHITNLSFKEGTFPHDLKIAKVIPIYKNKSNSSFENYRPISLLPTFSKVIERLVYNRLYKYVKLNNILNSAQYGFQNKLSTEQAIIELQNRVITYLAKKQHTIGIFIDLSKAFDTLNHSILLQKLNLIGIRGIPLKWFTSYLNNRTQFTEYLSHKSVFRNVKCGVPQGSILGPLLFLLYMNDLISVCKVCQAILFADDTTLLYNDTNYDALINKANSELSDISTWFAINKLSLNVEKTQFIQFQRNKATPFPKPLTLKINENTIQKVEYVKFLGVYIDQYMKWNEHISRKCNQISRTIGTLSRLKNILPRPIMLTLYSSLIVPYITYGVVAWGNTDNSQIKRMSILQKRSVRLINGSKYNSHTGPIFRSLRLLTLQDIFHLECCKVFAKFCQGQLPQYLNNIFVNSSSTPLYSFRNTTNITTPLVKTKFEEQLILFKVASAWNSLPINIKSYKEHPKSVKYFCNQFKNHKLSNYSTSCLIHNC